MATLNVCRISFEAWHVKHFLGPLTRSVGGSDYRNEKVRDRWEAWLACFEFFGKEYEELKFRIESLEK